MRAWDAKGASSELTMRPFDSAPLRGAALRVVGIIASEQGARRSAPRAGISPKRSRSLSADPLVLAESAGRLPCPPLERALKRAHVGKPEPIRDVVQRK